jgi:Pregnancy-associated plasma protein-A
LDSASQLFLQSNLHKSSMRLFLVFVLAFIGREFASAQNHDVLYCGQTQARERLFQEYPEAESCSHQATIELENKLLMDETMRGGGSDTTVYIIPVVFHIIHDNGPENISDEQIFDAIKVLNRDFRKQNADTAAIVSEFIGIAADVRIEFRLATKDPQGNCHPGIVRIQDALTYDGGNSAMKDLSFWPRNKYMNVWICAAIGGNVAGFTQMPPDVNSPWSASTDGIVLLHNYTGSIGTSNTLTSRTLTHETGHWLNLFHTWGPTNSPGDAQNCDFDDNVDDTPNTIGYTRVILPEHRVAVIWIMCRIIWNIPIAQKCLQKANAPECALHLHLTWLREVRSLHKAI